MKDMNQGMAFFKHGKEVYHVAGSVPVPRKGDEVVGDGKVLGVVTHVQFNYHTLSEPFQNIVGIVVTVDDK